VEGDPENHLGTLKALTDDLNAGKVDTLVIIGANPVYTAPADFGFAEALARAKISIALTEYVDETASKCGWHVPQSHLFEAWSDVRAFDGTVTIQQPQVMPLYGGRSAHELLALWLGDPQPDGAAIVRGTWRELVSAHGGTDYWNGVLRAGVVPDSAAPRVAVQAKDDFLRAVPPPAPVQASVTVLFRADPGMWDGRNAPNGWLQEMARPFTRLTWDNAALIAPRTAERLNLQDGDIVDLARGGRTIRAPAWILPGQAEDCVTLPLGYGRTAAGPVGTGLGFDAYALRTSDAAWQGADTQIAKTGAHHVLAPLQYYAGTEGRDLVREGTLADFLAHPDLLQDTSNGASLYPAFEYPGIAWAMSINLNSCIGCGACVIACQAENNVPVVGKEEVLRGRDMHWLRIDRYYQGALDAPETAFQPVPCMHCENAPCEVVCPVQATVHDSEGVNVMVYNRCVGTRFCSNNCPYKVRRFNFFDYTSRNPRLKQSWNPDVTVRARGVMEKCTYCVQRTREAMIASDRDNRPMRDGEVKTACQQACPTEAIVFGNRNDRASAVAHRKASPLDYVMLEDLNTKPRTSYEALIRNPNPELGDGNG
jgi:molybdopterin-containing oxidoreductase family iron-sulfur binding subunit